MKPIDKDNMDDFDKALFAEMRLNSDAHWKPPKWIWTALVAVKVAALTALGTITAVIFNK